MTVFRTIIWNWYIYTTLLFISTKLDCPNRMIFGLPVRFAHTHSSFFRLRYILKSSNILVWTFYGKNKVTFQAQNINNCLARKAKIKITRKQTLNFLNSSAHMLPLLLKFGCTVVTFKHQIQWQLVTSISWHIKKVRSNFIRWANQWGYWTNVKRKNDFWSCAVI